MAMPTEGTIRLVAGRGLGKTATTMIEALSPLLLYAGNEVATSEGGYEPPEPPRPRPLPPFKPLAGRNDPCPCGSGRKYKRCHRPRSNQTT